MSDLTNILSNKSLDNTEAIEELNEKTQEVQNKVELFSSVCQSVDNQILTITNSIVTLENEIVVLHTNAYAVGCGTTTGMSSMYPDTVNIQSYNISSKNYSGDDPYDVNSELINSSNVGLGTFMIHVTNDSSQSSIGSLYGDIGNCYRIFPPCGDCASFSASITAKQNQIVTLRSQLTPLITDVNKIKRERVDYEVERYGYNYAIDDMKRENRRIGAAITSIQTYET
jgi:hypothetical protein